MAQSGRRRRGDQCPLSAECGHLVLAKILREARKKFYSPRVTYESFRAEIAEPEAKYLMRLKPIELPKLHTRVRFPSPAPTLSKIFADGFKVSPYLLLVTIYGRADSSSQSECDGVSTFRKAQKYSQAAPKQSSTLWQPNSAARVTPLPRAGQTFRPAKRAQPSAPCPNQGWSRHRPGKLESTQQNPAFFQLSI